MFNDDLVILEISLIHKIIFITRRLLANYTKLTHKVIYILPSKKSSLCVLMFHRYISV